MVPSQKEGLLEGIDGGDHLMGGLNELVPCEPQVFLLVARGLPLTEALLIKFEVSHICVESSVGLLGSQVELFNLLLKLKLELLRGFLD